VTSETAPRTSAASDHHRTEPEAHPSAAERAVSKIVRQSTSHMLAGRAAGSRRTPCCGRTAHFAAVQVSRPPLGGAVRTVAMDPRSCSRPWNVRLATISGVGQSRLGLREPNSPVHGTAACPHRQWGYAKEGGNLRQHLPVPMRRVSADHGRQHRLPARFGKVPPTRSRRRPDWRIPPRSGGAGLGDQIWQPRGAGRS
jgi:hypothetical protein